MPIGVSEEHEALRESLRRWLEHHCPPSVPRAAFEESAWDLPAVWKEMADQGWLGVHLPESCGGQGYGLEESAVILEEAAYHMLPGPVLPTILASGLVATHLRPGQDGELLSGVAQGRVPAAVHLGPSTLAVTSRIADGAFVVSGVASPVLGGTVARRILLPVTGEDSKTIWCFVDLDPLSPAVRVEALKSLDPTRALAAIHFDGLVVPLHAQLSSLKDHHVRDLAVSLAAAECAGGARWCLDTASEYAKVRVQFSRPIGQFQAIKHKLADMLVKVEQIAAVAWDSAQGLGQASVSAGVAGAIALDGFVDCAKACIQILGGVGFTWEHDAHLFLRRAAATRQLFGPVERFVSQVASQASRGERRELSVRLPQEAEVLRPGIAAEIKSLVGLEPAELRKRLAEAGLMFPHWPAPWGRDAGPVEQQVISEELEACGIRVPSIGIGAWALPTIIAHGTPDQQRRWVMPTLLGQIGWCQLFSEPGAGSDLAGIATRAVEVDGGWRLTGQKVWTSLAREADLGICLARTGASEPKHGGLTYFVVPMHDPGIVVRPLRELTGAEMFNEVFLDGAFVPASNLVGKVNQGWGIARVTLANERVSISSGSTFGIGVEQLIKAVNHMDPPISAGAALKLGHLLAEAHSLRLLAHRAALRSISGMDPGPGGSVRKLLSGEHEQRVQELGMELCGAHGATLEGRAGGWAQGFLATRCLTIAGGTSEIQRNVIAERLLGLPRDPDVS